jgi:hypothetical protein
MELFVCYARQAMEVRSKWNDERLDAQFAHIDDRFDRLEDRFESRFDRLEARFDRLQIAMIVTLASLVATVVAARF